MQVETTETTYNKPLMAILAFSKEAYELLVYGVRLSIRLLAIYPSVLALMAVTSLLLVNEMSEAPASFSDTIYTLTTDIRDTTINASAGHIETTRCASETQTPSDLGPPTFIKCNEWVTEEIPLTTWATAVADGLLKGYLAIVVVAFLGALLMLGPRRAIALRPKSGVVVMDGIFVPDADSSERKDKK